MCPAVLAGCVWFPLTLTLPMNPRFVAAEVTRRIPLGDNSFRLITSAATRFSAARREDGFRGILSLREREAPCCVFLKSDVAPTGAVRSAIRRRDTRTTRRVGFAPKRREILPKGEGRGEGQATSCLRISCTGFQPSLRDLVPPAS